MNERRTLQQIRCGTWIRGAALGFALGAFLASNTHWEFPWVWMFAFWVFFFGVLLEWSATVWEFVSNFFGILLEWSASGVFFPMRYHPRPQGIAMTHRAAVVALRKLLDGGRSLAEAVWELHHIRGVDLLALWPVVAEVTGLDQQEAMRVVVQATSLLRVPPFPQPPPPPQAPSDALTTAPGLKAEEAPRG
jgi:hypothetical protein